MTYNFNPTQHSTKIKAGLLKAKQAGKKLGRPRGEKIKGESMVIRVYNYNETLRAKPDFDLIRITHKQIAKRAGVSKSTVQKIINKYRKEKPDF